MLVIHPRDKTTAMLSVLYEGQDAHRLDQDSSNKRIREALNRVPACERILLLGHGSDKGLLSREADGRDFDRLIVNHSHAFYLRRHPGNIVAIWCHADLFGRAEGLHGLFSGMIITELSEALLYEVPTTGEELVRENDRLFRRLRTLLDEGVPLREIPGRLQALDDARTPLTDFNYSHFYYL